MPQPGLETDRSLEGGAAWPEQVVARVRPDPIRAGVGDGSGDQVHRTLGDLQLRKEGAAGQILDCVAITVAGEKVHAAIAAPTLAQLGIDQAHALHQRWPVERGNGAHTDDDVAYRRIGRDLIGMLEAHHLIERHPPLGQPIVQKIE